MTSPTPTRQADSPGQPLSPESITRTLEGRPAEMSQYEFFIGEWDCELRPRVAGDAPPLALRGKWRAWWVHDGRMLVDDLTVYTPAGQEVLGWVNLRTWSADNGCWEISGQRVLAPSSGAITHAWWRDGEMQLEFDTASGGRVVHNTVRFFEITADSFEWEWRCRDDGQSHSRLFASLSARRARSAGS